MIRQAPGATGQMLIALDFDLGPTPEIVIVGDPRRAETSEVLAGLRRHYVPNRVVACRAPGAAPADSPLAALFEGKTATAGQPAVYVCEHHACQAPQIGQEAAMAAWKKLAATGDTS